jgi:hypothetical protein
LRLPGLRRKLGLARLALTGLASISRLGAGWLLGPALLLPLPLWLSALPRLGAALAPLLALPLGALLLTAWLGQGATAARSFVLAEAAAVLFPVALHALFHRHVVGIPAPCLGALVGAALALSALLGRCLPGRLLTLLG